MFLPNKPTFLMDPGEHKVCEAEIKRLKQEREDAYGNCADRLEELLNRLIKDERISRGGRIVEDLFDLSATMRASVPK